MPKHKQKKQPIPCLQKLKQLLIKREAKERTWLIKQGLKQNKLAIRLNKLPGASPIKQKMPLTAPAKKSEAESAQRAGKQTSWAGRLIAPLTKLERTSAVPSTKA